MLKKIFSLLIFSALCIPVFAEEKIAVVDVGQVIQKSSQVQALRKEQEAKRKEIAQFIKKAGDEIKAQTDDKKKNALAEKYNKELNAKREANAKAYKTKLEAIDKSISETIVNHAKSMGYTVVLTKGVVLYGGTDITEAVKKVVK